MVIQVATYLAMNIQYLHGLFLKSYNYTNCLGTAWKKVVYMLKFAGSIIYHLKPYLTQAVQWLVCKADISFSPIHPNYV